MRNVAWIALAAGIALLALNLAGVAMGQRSTRLADDQFMRTVDPLRIQPEEFWREARRHPGETDREFVGRATGLVDDAIAHGWGHYDLIGRYAPRVPLRENFVLWGLSWARPEVYRNYEFCSARKAVERGLGLCSQVSIVLVTVLQQNGVEASIAGLSGHVVVRARVAPDRWIIADPDTGVVFDHDLSDLETNTSIVIAAYRSTGMPEVVAQRLSKAYLPPGNVLVSSVEEFASVCRIERAAYWVKWSLPPLLILFAAALLELLPRARSDAQELAKKP